MVKNTRFIEAQNALIKVAAAIKEAQILFIGFHNEGKIENHKIQLMKSMMSEFIHRDRGAFKKYEDNLFDDFNQIASIFESLVCLFERPNCSSARGAPKKIFERVAITHLAIIFKCATRGKTTITKDPVTNERRSDYLNFVTAVTSRVWEGPRPTALIEEVGRALGTEIGGNLPD
jgi:hypothetical protein